MAHSTQFKEIYDRLEFDNPCPEVHMIGRNDGKFICHVLRQIYQKTDDPEIKIKARIATTMARKMIFKLGEFNIGWPELYAMTRKTDGA